MSAYYALKKNAMAARRLARMLVCRHEYEKIGFTQVERNNLRFPIRTYRCRKCRKRIQVDGRYDPFAG